MSHVLVLNSSFEPLLIVSWQKALQLLFQGKVEVIEEYDREVRTISMKFKVPSVLRLLKFIPIKKKRNLIRFSRTNIFLRDQFTCQYCGRKKNKLDLTLDHVIPSVQGGPKTWENIVTACMLCNQKKGGRTPQEAGMRLVSSPKQPEWLPSYQFKFSLKSAPENWKVYLSWQMTFF
jgi:5-methylcytosine-specific restriction endonuclease McrA